ncbi:MAG TPA: hypothetical protein PLZ21_07540, partial [Armatimonadota bacterium]|nr:hypothetical protein [Armatimonadota bacterium]
MEFDKRDEGAFWTHNTDECEETIEGTVDWFPIADEFPEMLWCLYYPERDTYTCHALPNDPGAYGLVTFSTLVIGEKFIRGMSNRKPGLTGCVPVVRTFDEARMLA